jgi:two-component system sensor histidine kinase MtrB
MRTVDEAPSGSDRRSRRALSVTSSGSFGQRSTPPSRHKLGLRARVTILFALGAAILSGALASITYYSVRDSLLSEQRSTLSREAFASALLLRPELQYNSVLYPYFLKNTAPADGLDSLLYAKPADSVGKHAAKHWYSSTVEYAPPRPVPAALRRLSISGTPAYDTIDLGNVPTFVVGVPMPAVDATYFELFSLEQTARTLHVLLATLVLAALVVTLGGALVGSWASSRALHPLHEAAQASLAIAGGRLDTRLETDAHADLAMLTSAFNRMADRLQERIEREISFTSDVNHELRSPLTTLAASLAVLEGRRDTLDERSKQALDLLGAEVRRFRRLVDDLLEISRVDAGLSDLSLTEVSLGELVPFSVNSTALGVPIDIAPEALHARVLVDKRRFERIIANLLENAEYYAGGATRVVVTTDRHQAVLVVEDQGPGIPPDERGRIFERFSRGTSGRRRGLGEGTGLGLAIVAEHVRILGGTVGVEENVPSGARFVVVLPLVMEDHL